MKIIRKRTVSPKEMLAGVKKAIAKSQRPVRVGKGSKRLDKDIRCKLQLVLKELENLETMQDVLKKHLERKVKKSAGKG